MKRKRTQVKREKSKGTQAKAAELLGVSQPTIAKYEMGKRTMLLRVALEIQRLNTGKAYDNSWQKKHKREKIFKLNSQTHIAWMRIDALGKRFAYEYHKDDEMVFKVVPKTVDQGGGKFLKALRAKRHWTQAQAGKFLHVSQSMIALYESGKRVLPRPIAVRIQRLNSGLTSAEIKQLKLLQRGNWKSAEKIVT